MDLVLFCPIKKDDCMTLLTRYQGVVRDFLTLQLRYWAPPHLRSNDIEKATELFIQIVLEKAEKQQASMDIAAKEPTDDPVVEKIKTIVENKAPFFKEACETGFPFSRVDPEAGKISLKTRMKRMLDSIVAPFLLQGLSSKVLTEEELNVRFGEAFNGIDSREIAHACYNLREQMKTDSKAGYYLLWMIKWSTGAAFEIPPPEECIAERVRQVLSDFVGRRGFLKKPHLFVQILIFSRFRPQKPLFSKALNNEQWQTFLEFAAECLQKTPMHEWPAKKMVIADFLETIDARSRPIVAEQLASSPDEETARIGLHVLDAFRAVQMRDAIVHYYALEKLLPEMSTSHFKEIFGTLFDTLCYDDRDDPSFVRRLKFDHKNVFFFENMLIGVQGTGRKIPHLLAFDKDTEKMIWGMKLEKTTPPFFPWRFGEYLVLQLQKSNEFCFIHAKTGEITARVSLPGQFRPWEDLHLSPEGFCYIRVGDSSDKKLVGGKIVDGSWQPIFERKIQMGALRPLSTHASIYEQIEEQLTLFASTGASTVFHHCLSFYAKGDKLYLVQRGPNKECILSVRTLLNDDRVVSEEVQTVQVAAFEPYIKEVCENGLCVLLGRDDHPIFVNLLTSQVVKSPHKIVVYAKCIMNEKTGDLWSWDCLSKKLFKINGDRIDLMGQIHGDETTKLIHIDSNERLFIC